MQGDIGDLKSRMALITQKLEELFHWNASNRAIGATESGITSLIETLKHHIIVGQHTLIFEENQKDHGNHLDALPSMGDQKLVLSQHQPDVRKIEMHMFSGEHPKAWL